jgi:predicted PurR-regulated permease PerM
MSSGRLGGPVYRGAVADSAGEDRPVRSRVWRAGLTPASAALLVGAVVTAMVLRDVFVAAHRTVGWVVACAIVAALIDPLVDFVDRLVPRWIAVIVVLLAMLSLVGAVMVGLASELIDSLDELKESAPAAAAELEERYEWMDDLDVGARVDAFVQDLDERVRKDAVSQAAETAPTYVVTSILMLFLLAYGRRYFEGFVDQFPEERRDGLRFVGQQTVLRGRLYLLVALGHSILNGLLIGWLCWALDLPAAVSLGVAVAAFTLLPLIGVLVGGIPALLLAFGLGAWRDGVVVLAALLVLQAIEVAVVRPRVDRRSVRVGPTIPIVIGLLGFELYGVGGAIYGIALAVFALAALDAVGRLRGDEPVAEVAP